jgi:hypothetical protein
MSLPLLSRIFSELSAPVLALRAQAFERPEVPLPSRLSTGHLAWSSVAAATMLASPSGMERLDPDRIAVAYRSDRVLAIDGAAPPVWSPYSGFWRTSDGWIRTHGNYAHHAARLLTGLGLGASDSPEALRRAFAERSSREAVSAVSAARGLAVEVSPEVPRVDEELRRTPLLPVVRRDTRASPRAHRAGDPVRPLLGVRVLDLTRVIAGPVATRTLALWGADVLRIDPPALPEPEWQHLDTGHGKRSAVLDAHSPRMEELLARADVVVLGYRHASLHRLGLDADALAMRHPHMLVAQLSAWGLDNPARAGFDSLVQAESGIAMIESPDGDRPGALPAQALDHSAGYLLAAAILRTLERREAEGGSWFVHTSLRRIAAELLGMTRRDDVPSEAPIDFASHTVRFVVGGRTLVTAGPAIPAVEYAAPRPWGRDQPRW